MRLLAGFAAFAAIAALGWTLGWLAGAPPVTPANRLSPESAQVARWFIWIVTVPLALAVGGAVKAAIESGGEGRAARFVRGVWKFLGGGVLLMLVAIYAFRIVHALGVPPVWPRRLAGMALGLAAWGGLAWLIDGIARRLAARLIAADRIGRTNRQMHGS